MIFNIIQYHNMILKYPFHMSKKYFNFEDAKSVPEN